MKKKFALWEQAILYVALFFGFRSIINKLIQPLLSFIATPLLTIMQSPNFTFSPEQVAVISVGFLLFITALYISLRFMMRIFAPTKPIQFSIISSLVYIFLIYYPSLRILLLNQEMRRLLFSKGSSALIPSTLVESFYLIIFFSGTYYFTRNKKSATK